MQIRTLNEIPTDPKIKFLVHLLNDLRFSVNGCIACTTLIQIVDVSRFKSPAGSLLLLSLDIHRVRTNNRTGQNGRAVV